MCWQGSGAAAVNAKHHRQHHEKSISVAKSENGYRHQRSGNIVIA